MLDYTTDEMLTQVDFDLPVCQKEKESLDNERIMLKQLIANIERNRVKWRKDVFESDSLSN
jgi:hypothetical protein